MKRAILLLALAALPLAGCGGKAKDPSAQAATADKAKPGAAKDDHVNPWAKDGAAKAPPAPAPAKSAEKAKPATDAHANPWAKDPPPGSEPLTDKSKPKAK